MKKNIRTGLGLAALTAALVTAAAWARTTGVFAQPTAVAVVNFDALQSDLHEQDKISAGIAATFQPLLDELEAMRIEYDALVEKLTIEVPTMTEDEKRDLNIRGILLEQKMRATDEIRGQALQVEIYAAMQDYYPKIYAAIDYIAKRDGWDIVMLDTSIIDRSKALDLNSLNESIARRHILFASANVDITEDVQQWLNEEFDKAQAQPAKAIP